MTQTQTTDTDVREISLDHRFPYFRFDPDLDRDVLSDEWIKSRKGNGAESGTLRDIERWTNRYLKTDVVQARLR